MIALSATAHDTSHFFIGSYLKLHHLIVRFITENQTKPFKTSLENTLIESKRELSRMWKQPSCPGTPKPPKKWPHSTPSSRFGGFTQPLCVQKIGFGSGRLLRLLSGIGTTCPSPACCWRAKSSCESRMMADLLSTFQPQSVHCSVFESGTSRQNGNC